MGNAHHPPFHRFVLTVILFINHKLIKSMKKNYLIKERHASFLQWKTFLIMKLLTVFILGCLMQSYAVVTKAQNKRINFRFENNTLKEVLQKLEEETEFSFIYRDELVNSAGRVTENFQNEKVTDLLTKVLVNENMTYLINGRVIVIMPNDIELQNSQQQKSVSGKVTDSSGSSLPGVSVVVKGTTTGVITDMDGKYSLSKVPENAILQFSFVGMKTQEIVVGNKTNINVTLAEETIGIEEVVALGYTTQKRKDMIGSIAKISDQQIATPAYSNFTAALQGKASGVFISGGQVRIRGMNSISLSTEPLWIIDGVPGNASSLNPNDIESISILKDASATALYGSSGANGVIAVTTKSMKGMNSQITVELDGGFSELMGTDWSLMNTADFFAFMDITKQNAAKYDGNPYVPYDPNKAFDWDQKIKNRMTREQAAQYSNRGMDEALQSGHFTQMHLNTSKGFDKGSALFTATCRKQDGDFIGSSNQKLVTRIALNYSPIKNVDLSINSINQYNQGDTNVSSNPLRRTPFMPIYDVNDATGYWGPGDNPIINGDKKFRDQNNESFNSLSYLKANVNLPFIKGLSIAGTTSASFGFNRNVDWYSKELLSYSNQGISQANESSGFGKTFLLRAEANYNRTIKDHTFSVLAIAEYKKTYGNGLYAAGYNLNGTYHILGTPSNMISMNSTIAEGGSAAYIGRLTYKLKERYLFETNIRRDGLSVLSENNRWATFPSIGAGWVVNEESFFHSSLVNLLKIRGSIGKTGNAAVPSFVYLPQFSLVGPGGGTVYDEYMASFIKSIPADVKWETSDNFDFGFDFGLLNNRINGSLAYYLKKTSGLLLQVPTPPSTGLGTGTNSVWSNVGNMKNDGFEFNVNFSAIHNPNFTWDISFNHTVSHNEVLALQPQADLTGSGIFGGSYTYSLTKKGEEIATYYLSDFAGIDPQKGIPLIWERDPVVFKATGNTVRTGNKIPATLSNAGANQFLLHGKSYMPSFYGGLRNTFHYNNFDLNLMIVYSGGNYFLDQTEKAVKSPHFGESNLLATLLVDSWKNPGDIANEPEVIYNGGFYYDNLGNQTKTRSEPFDLSTKYLKPGGNLQVKEITLGYTLPKKLTTKCLLNDVRVYANVNNLFYLAKAGRLGNPEISAPSNNIDGVVRGETFLPRMYSFGVSIKF